MLICPQTRPVSRSITGMDSTPLVAIFLSHVPEGLGSLYLNVR